MRIVNEKLGAAPRKRNDNFMRKNLDRGEGICYIAHSLQQDLQKIVEINFLTSQSEFVIVLILFNMVFEN